MTSEDKAQFKVRIPRSIQDGFRRAVSRKYGIDKYGLLSYEMQRLIEYYILVGGILPSTARTHKGQHLEGHIAPKPTIEMTAAIVSGGNGGNREEYNNCPPHDDPILRQWLLTKGIDVANPDSIAGHITEEDIKVGELPEAELMQWNNGIYNRLIAIRRQRDTKKWLVQEGHLERDLEPELRQIKSYLVNSDSIKGDDRVHEDLLYSAWSVVTRKTDRQRTFKNNLKRYETAGYLSIFDCKRKIYRAERKLMSL
jgi:hypothetical protein